MCICFVSLNKDHRGRVRAGEEKEEYLGRVSRRGIVEGVSGVSSEPLLDLGNGRRKRIVDEDLLQHRGVLIEFFTRVDERAKFREIQTSNGLAESGS